MTRILKFRVWDEYSKAIQYDDDETDVWAGVRGAWVTSSSSSEQFADNVTQFTGLKDKTGRDIYEGDTCLCRMHGTDSHVEEVETEVIYDLTVGAFGHKVTSKNSDYTFFGLNSKNLLSCELIGNIYGEIYL